MLNIKTICLITAVLLSQTACNTIPTWAAIGGSRADGTVKIAYEQSEFSNQSPMMDDGRILAARRCEKWGYSDAEAFGGATRTCIRSPGVLTNCAVYQIVFEFQCINPSDNINNNINININNNNYGTEIYPQ
ncbi:MAG: hypothetical protein IK065_05135 [Neisseriaceae bacterium]|nr:hypothetical protein [Neisseriaceae bacterium]